MNTTTCPHTEIERTPDPSGGSDSAYTCKRCGASLDRSDYLMARDFHTTTTKEPPVIEMPYFVRRNLASGEFDVMLRLGQGLAMDNVGFFLSPIDAERQANTLNAAFLAGAASRDDEVKRLKEALQGVIRVADRKTVEFDAARAALGAPRE